MRQTESIKEQCRQLWKDVFGDSDEFIDRFMTHYFCYENMLCIEQGGKLQSMLHIVPFELNGEKAAYIYAVATAAEARGKGYATELMKRAINKAQNEGYKAIVTLPADEELYKFYARFGFKGKHAVEFITDEGIDFGTGESEKDFATVLLMDDSLTLPDDGITLTHRK